MKFKQALRKSIYCGDKSGMEKLTLVYVILLCSVACNAQRVNFQGTWQYTATGTEFTLNLIQKGSALSGYHYAVWLNGNRIDASADSTDIIISGNINPSNEALIIFRSSYSNTKGKVRLTKLSPSKIKWEIVKRPSGEYYLPDVAILVKQ